MLDVSRTSSRNFPTELGALGGAIALWAALSAVAATEAGALVGNFIGFGVSLVSLPLVMMGIGATVPLIVIACLGFGALMGVIYLIAGFARTEMRSLAIRGVHFIGFTAAVFLCLRGVVQAI